MKFSSHARFGPISMVARWESSREGTLNVFFCLAKKQMWDKYFLSFEEIWIMKLHKTTENKFWWAPFVFLPICLSLSLFLHLCLSVSLYPYLLLLFSFCLYLSVSFSFLFMFLSRNLVSINLLIYRTLKASLSVLPAAAVTLFLISVSLS